jgi:hypothetical protein
VILVIREATVEDIPSILPLARDFLDHVTLQHIPEDDVAKTLKYFLTPHDETFSSVFKPKCVAFIASDDDGPDAKPHGVLVLAKSSTWFSPKVKLAVELAWFISEERRCGTAAIRLLQAAQAWAREQECDAMVMHSMTLSDGSDAAKSILMRLGFQPREHVYVQEF